MTPFYDDYDETFDSITGSSWSSEYQLHKEEKYIVCCHIMFSVSWVMDCTWRS